MAVRFDAATDQISRATAPSLAAGFTFLCWVYLSVDRNDYSTFMRINAGGVTRGNLATDGNGQTLAYYTIGGSLTSSTVMTEGAWHRAAIVITGTTGTLYTATAAGTVTSVSGTVSADADPTALAIGGRGGGETTEWWNGRVAYARMWTAALTQAEVEAEWASPTPVRTSGLWADWPLPDATDLTDHSGNARHLTAGSTAGTTEPGPPMQVSGAGAAVLGALTGTAAGTRGVLGGAVASLGALTGGGSGVRAVTGVVAGQLGAVTGSAVGARSVAGTAVASLGSLTATGSGSGAHPMIGGNTVTGTGTAILGAITAVAVGTRTPAAGGSGHRPVTDLVARAWLASLPGLSPGMVGATLPQDTSTWATSGFVQTTTIGGIPDQDTGLRPAHVQVDCWAVRPGSGKPPWYRAGQLAELIVEACVDGTGQQATVSLGPHYDPARVLTVRALGEPRRAPGDDGGYAHLFFDIAVAWCREG